MLLDALVFLLAVIGFLSVLSSSTNVFVYNFSQSFEISLGLKQIFFTSLGLGFYLLLPKLVSSERLLKWRLWFYGLCVALLVIIFTPLGVEVNGSRRWIATGLFNLQPSELTRLALVVFFAGFLASKKGEDFQKWPIFALACAFLFVPIGLILLQTDLSSAVVIVMVVFSLFLLAGFRWLFLFSVAGFGAFCFLTLVVLMPTRLARFSPTLTPWDHQLGSGYQSMQALIAQQLGGPLGQGYSHSFQKFDSLPEAHNDYIFSIFYEEWGILGALMLVLLFCLLIYYIFAVSHACLQRQKTFASFVCIGIGLTIFFQCFFNIGVNLGLLPPTGLNLPLVSYGGTSLITTLISLAIVKTIAKELDLPDQALKKAEFFNLRATQPSPLRR